MEGRCGTALASSDPIYRTQTISQTLMDWTDDVVYSNVAYALSALAAPTGTSAGVMALAGAALAVGSSVYHARYDRVGLRLDIGGILTYIAALATAVSSVWVSWVWLVLVPIAALYYWRAHDIWMEGHVGGWMVLVLALLWVQVGMWALLPAGAAAVGLVVRFFIEPHSDSWWHSIWHLCEALAGALVLGLL